MSAFGLFDNWFDKWFGRYPPRTYRTPLVCPDCDRPLLATLDWKPFGNSDTIRIYCERAECNPTIELPERFLEDMVEGKIEFEEVKP
jgi:hypothetical protein